MSGKNFILGSSVTVPSLVSGDRNRVAEQVPQEVMYNVAVATSVELPKVTSHLVHSLNAL